MGSNKGEGAPDFDQTRAEVFEAISHPLRIKILQSLDGEPKGFAELGRAVGIQSGGHLSFHLAKLGNLVRVNSDGKYALTGDGKEALWTINALRKSNIGITSKVSHREWLKPTLAIVLIALVILGVMAAYQQGEFSSQQQQVASEQKLIGTLESGVPFTTGQSASLVIGQKNFTNYEARISQNGLHGPSEVAFDSSGNMWVADLSNNRVLEFKPPFGDGMNASLVLGQKDFISALGSNASVMGQTAFGSITRSGLNSPGGVVFDSSGDLWVTDFGNDRVVEFTPPFTTGMNATLVIGALDFYSGGAATSASSLSSPDYSIFDSAGNLWTIDSGNNRVLEFRPPFSNGMNASLVLGQTNFQNSFPSHALNGLNCLYGDLAIDSSGDIWVGDTLNNRIIEFRPPFSNGMNASFVITEQNLPVNTETLGAFGASNLGAIVAFDPAGNLWASSNDRLVVFKPPFTPSIRSFPAVEIGQPNFTSPILWYGGQSGLGNPSHPAFDSSGNLWVPDFQDNRILEFVAASSPQTVSISVLGFPSLVLFEYAVIGGSAAVLAGVLGVTFLRRRETRTRKEMGY